MTAQTEYKASHSEIEDAIAPSPGPYHAAIDYKPIDFDDPHRAALEDNPDKPEALSLSTALAVVSLALSFAAPVGIAFATIIPIGTQIGTALDDTTHVSWIDGGWSIASSVSFSIAGSLSDVFGRRYTIIFGQVVAIIGMIVAGTAQTTLIVAAGSTIIGFGGGFIFVAYAGIQEILPNKWRGLLGLTEVAMTLPWGTAGTLIGVSLNEYTAAGWRWIYYIAIIMAVISMLGTLIWYWPPQRPQYDFERTRWDEIKDVDYIGFTLYTGGLTVFLIGLTWAGTTGHPWKSASTIVPIVVGFVMLVFCFLYDFYLAKQPLFPRHLFWQVRSFTLLLVVVFLSGAIFYSMVGLSPQGTLYTFTNNSIQIGVIALPAGIGQFIFGGLVTLTLGFIGHLRLQMVFWFTLQTVFTATGAWSIHRHKVAYSVLQFFSQGPFLTVTVICYIIAGLHVPLKYLGLAAGLIGTFRSWGGSIGNAVLNTILTNIKDEQITKRISAVAVEYGMSTSAIPSLIAAAIENAVGESGAFASVPGITSEIEAATIEACKEAYAYAFRIVFLATIPFGVVGIATACFVRDPSQYLTNHTAVHMTKGSGLGHSHHEPAQEKGVKGSEET